MFYSKIFTMRKITHAHVPVPSVCNRNQESVVTCSYNYLIGVCYVDPDLPKDGLPNPKGPLSLSIPSQVIALANHEVATKG